MTNKNWTKVIRIRLPTPSLEVDIHALRHTHIWQYFSISRSRISPCVRAERRWPSYVHAFPPSRHGHKTQEPNRDRVSTSFSANTSTQKNNSPDHGVIGRKTTTVRFRAHETWSIPAPSRISAHSRNAGRSMSSNRAGPGRSITSSQLLFRRTAGRSAARRRRRGTSQRWRRGRRRRWGARPRRS